MSIAVTLCLLAFLLDGLIEGLHWKRAEKDVLLYAGAYDLYHPLTGLRHGGWTLAVWVAAVTGDFSFANLVGCFLLGGLGFREVAMNMVTRGRPIAYKEPYHIGKWEVRRYPWAELAVSVLIGGWLCLP